MLVGVFYLLFCYLLYLIFYLICKIFTLSLYSDPITSSDPITITYLQILQAIQAA